MKRVEENVADKTFSLKEFVFADLGAAILWDVIKDALKHLLKKGGEAGTDAAAKIAADKIARMRAIAARRSKFEAELRSIPSGDRRTFTRRYKEAIRTGREDRFVGLVTETVPDPQHGWVPFVLWGETVSDEVWNQHLEVLDDNPWEQRWTRARSWAETHDAQYAKSMRKWRRRQQWLRRDRRHEVHGVRFNVPTLVSMAVFVILAGWGGYILFIAAAK